MEDGVGKETFIQSIDGTGPRVREYNKIFKELFQIFVGESLEKSIVKGSKKQSVVIVADAVKADKYDRLKSLFSTLTSRFAGIAKGL